MIKIYVYDKNTLRLSRVDIGMAEDVMRDVGNAFDFTLAPPPDYKHIWRWIEDKWVADEPEPVSIEQHQDEAWEFIKRKRLEQTTSGVLVKSVDKFFHTDPTSAIQYSTVAGMIALDNYEPIMWKVMDNTWVSLTSGLFRELQVSMRANTQQTYMIAEQHKTAMLESENPLEYDYQSGWLNGVVDYA